VRQKEGVIIERRYKQGSRGGLLLLGMGLCNPNLIRNINNHNLSVINDKHHLSNNNKNHSLTSIIIIILSNSHSLTPTIMV